MRVDGYIWVRMNKAGIQNVTKWKILLYNVS